MTTIAFYIGAVAIHWYGIILAGSLVFGLGVILWQARIYKESRMRAIEMFLFAVPIGLVLSRVYFILANWSFYQSAPGEWLQLWHGGLALHGAFVGMVAVIAVYTYYAKVSFWRWCDIFAPGCAAAQAVGQWGNFINQEAFGYPTAAAWGIYIDFANRPHGFEQYDFFHPTFLYESSLALVILVFTLLWNITKAKRKYCVKGSTFLLYTILYSAGRFCIEEFRIDSEFFFGFRLAQTACLLIVAASAILWLKREKTIN